MSLTLLSGLLYFAHSFISDCITIDNQPLFAIIMQSIRQNKKHVGTLII